MPFSPEKGINYCVDLSLIAKGKKIDRYTEIPRVISKAKEENAILKYLTTSNINFRFVKVIADTNAWYITPNSIPNLGEKLITQAHQDFKQLIIKYAGECSIPVEVYLFTDLIKPFQIQYDVAYEEALTILQSINRKLQIYDSQIARTQSHIGFTDTQQIKAFTNRTIATHAAEGMVFNALSKTDYFSNGVWLNIEEVNQRTIAITNSLRIKNGLGNLPMIFAKCGD